MSEWHKRAVCPECGWHTRAPFGVLFHVAVDVCPSCGAEKGVYAPGNLAGMKSWKIKTMRYFVDWSRVVWWAPWTWPRAGAWEVLNDTGAERALGGGE